MIHSFISICYQPKMNWKRRKPHTLRFRFRICLIKFGTSDFGREKKKQISNEREKHKDEKKSV